MLISCHGQTPLSARVKVAPVMACQVSITPPDRDKQIQMRRFAIYRTKMLHARYRFHWLFLNRFGGLSLPRIPIVPYSPGYWSPLSSSQLRHLAIPCGGLAKPQHSSSRTCHRFPTLMVRRCEQKLERDPLSKANCWSFHRGILGSFVNAAKCNGWQ